MYSGRRIAEESRYFCFVCAKNEASQKWSWVKWTQGEELLKKVVIFVLFARKSEVSQKWCLVKVKQSHGLLHRCFWPGNISVVLRPMDGQKTVRFHQKYLNLVPKMNEGLRFRTTWGRVINDRISFWVNEPFNMMLIRRLTTPPSPAYQGRPVRGLRRWVLWVRRSGPLIVSRCRERAEREGPLAPRLVWPLLAQ